MLRSEKVYDSTEGLIAAFFRAAPRAPWMAGVWDARPSRGEARSALFLDLVLRDPRLHQLFHQRGRQRLVHGKLDGAFGCAVSLEIVLERLDQGSTHWKQAAMVLKRGERHQRSFVPEGRDPIADGFGGLRWHDRPNRRADLV